MPWRRASSEAEGNETYYVDTVGKNAVAIKNYIDNQLKEDRIAEQLTIDKIDPFTGSKK